MATVIDMSTYRPRTLTPRERMEALYVAAENEGYAELCTKDQATLRALFVRNAELLRKLAKHEKA